MRLAALLARVRQWEDWGLLALLVIYALLGLSIVLVVGLAWRLFRWAAGL